MKILRTYLYIISILWVSAGFSQENQNNSDASANDSIVYKQRYGLRVGVDLSRLIRSFSDDRYQGFEIVGDYRLNRRWYAAAEIGNEEKTTDEDYMNFTTKGSYIKLGGDRNSYNNWYGMENVISLGFRYGFSTFNQTVNSYTPSTSDPYWGEYEIGGDNPDIIREYKGRSAHWLEFVLSLKVELVHNVFAGASVRLGKMITDKTDSNFPNLWVPGFNKVTDGSSFGMGYNYSITYLIPLYSKTKKEKLGGKTEKESKDKPKGEPLK